MPDDHVELLLRLFGDLARLEADVTELSTVLADLANDELLASSAGLRSEREGIMHLCRTLLEVEVEIAEARGAAADAIAQRRSTTSGIDRILTLYRDVTRTELEMAQLEATIDRATANEAVRLVPQLTHLAGSLTSVQSRLASDHAILGRTQQGLERLILEGG